MSKVSTTHPDYDAHINTWVATRDCVNGSTAIKAARTTYLPKPCPEDLSQENDLRYNDYVERANFVGFTESTLEGMLGMVFRKDFTVELPAAIEYLVDNANGAGLTLDQLARELVSETTQTGRYGLMVDYPTAPAGLTREQEVKLNLRANVLGYRAEDCINWGTDVFGGVTRLSLVVLREKTRVWDADGFDSDEVYYYRVLRLIDGVYNQFFYDDDGAIVSESVPKAADGSTWKMIPFVFVGSKNNDPGVDRSPLHAIASVNIAHYRNSADYEESSFMVGQPTPVFGGLSQSWVDQVMKGGVKLGSRAPILLPENGNAILLQANPNQMPEKGMEIKEKQMIMLGARLIQDAGGNETAEAARIRYAGQNSKLGAIVGNVESALIQAIEWAGLFMGDSGEVVIEINREFYDRTIDPQLIMASIQLLDRGIIAQTDLRSSLREAGLIDAERTDEEIDGEAEENVMAEPATPGLGGKF